MPICTDAHTEFTLAEIRLGPLEWIVVSLLLVLRFPFLIAGEFIPFGLSASAQMTIYVDLTYGVTGVLFILQRSSLKAFFATRAFLWMFIVAPVAAWTLSVALSGPGMMNPIRPLLALTFTWVLRRELLGRRRDNDVDTRASIVPTVGIVFATVTVSALALAIQQRVLFPGTTAQPAQSWTRLLGGVMVQLVNAGLSEEPLFRGILLALLIRKMKPWPAIPLQAALFTLGHGYYILRSPVSLFFVVPLGGVALGWIAFRHRSLVHSTAAHGIVNELGHSVQYLWSMVI